MTDETSLLSEYKPNNVDMIYATVKAVVRLCRTPFFIVKKTYQTSQSFRVVTWLELDGQDFRNLRILVIKRRNIRDFTKERVEARLGGGYGFFSLLFTGTRAINEFFNVGHCGNGPPQEQKRGFSIAHEEHDKKGMGRMK